MRCWLTLASLIPWLFVAPAVSAAEGGDPAPVDSIKAFLEQHCWKCHSGDKPEAELRLDAFRDERSIVKARKTWEKVLRMANGGEMPPPERPRPTADELASLTKAVEGIYERAIRGAKPDPGHVTIRRLNRVEYNATIRDLVGVDFQPAEDFPSDDVGHGFDNIGDVLSISPVLMERYLAAAEAIVQRAIIVDPPKPPVRRQAARYLEPAQSSDVRTRSIADNGKLHTPWKLTLDGEYVLRVRAYGQPAEDQPPKISLQIDGKELAVHDVTADEQNPAVYEANVTLAAGEVRGAVVLLNPSEGENKRTVHVYYLELQGPTDTRPPAQRALLACPADRPHAEQTRVVIERFASRAYRRPVLPTEVERLVKLVEAEEAKGEKWESAIQLAFQAVLVNPKFLFRLELDDRPDAPDAHPIDDYQLASRLSYFLWSTMPDAELTALAAQGQLGAQLEPQVRRMLADPKSKALVENFAIQWLQLRRIKSFAPDPKLFPSFNDGLRAAMLTETAMFVDAVFRENRSILDLIDANFTFLNEPLARHYGIVDDKGNLQGQPAARPGGAPIRGREFRRVELSDGLRGGLLTQASVLTVTSNPTRTSPVKRGRWVLEQLLGTPPPAPPPNVPELPNDEKSVLSGSLRQRLEQHRAKPACANCHASMDPLGFAFENFDAIGAYRTKDGEFAIDTVGELPDGQKIQGPADLKAVLRGKKELFARCLTEKLLIYALGRGLEYYDKPAVDRIQSQLAAGDYKFSTLVLEIARSDPFRMRRGTSQADAD